MFSINSILNNDLEEAVTNGPTTCKPPKFQAQLPPPTSFVRRPRTSLATSSSPSNSPPNTPPLLRSDSQDSSTMNGTPSPVTPTFNEFGQPQSKSTSPTFEQSAGPYFAGSAGSAPLPQLSQMPFAMPHQAPQQWYPELAAGVPAAMLQQHVQASSLLQQHQPQSSFAPTASAQDSPARRHSTSSNKKNSKYPCPLAAQYSCPDMFTTSGHAARHAKKHTGKKDAICPDCGKAFTRKDNMEQHRRTHKNGKTPSKSSDESSQPKKQKLSSSKSKPRPAPLQTDVGFSQTAHDMVDPALPLSPSSSYGGLPTGQLPLSGMYTMSLGGHSAYPDPTSMSGYSPQMSMMHSTGYTPTTPGMTVGLDTLALAATSSDEDLKRKFSEDL